MAPPRLPMARPRLPRLEPDELAGVALILVALGFALFVQSGPFLRSNFILGDIAYHRGVAYTMQGGNLQGEGPYPGLLSYYGGLYPLLLGTGAEIVGLTFDRFLSAVSWLATLFLPLSLVLLGRRLWETDLLSIGVLTLLGTVAAPFAVNESSLWVWTILPSGANFWPLFPRDLALVLLVLVAWAVLAEARAARVAGTGLLLAVTVLVHLQIGIAAALLVAAWLAVGAARERAPGLIADLGLIALIAAGASVWWWLPRLTTFSQSGRLILADFQGQSAFRMDLPGFVVQYGLVGLLAVGALLLLWRRHRPGPDLTIVAVWLAVLLPFVVLDRLLGGTDFFSERRVWLMASIPLLLLAAVAATWLVRRLPGWIGATALAAVILLTALPATGATQAVVRAQWPSGEAAGQVLPPSLWGPVWRELNRRVRRQGSYTVLTYDSNAAWTWSFSGAQIVSGWLPGYLKLGFDPEPLTGYSHRERLERLNGAFGTGLPGICELARKMSVDALLLERHDGLVGTYDLTPASLYRVDPADRADAPILQQIDPDTTYVANFDRLRLKNGATFGLDWRAPNVRQLVVEVRTNERFEQPILRVSGTGEVVQLGQGAQPGYQRFTIQTPGGLGRPIEIRALRPFHLMRVTGYERLELLDGLGGRQGSGGPDGPFLAAPRRLCGNR
ncbi:MAG: hypothetical protein H0X16_12130 [Chloroflexi bacterium]|nr:hypothetical protein [Chloroflexota bacterium]